MAVLQMQAAVPGADSECDLEEEGYFLKITFLLIEHNEAYSWELVIELEESGLGVVNTQIRSEHSALEVYKVTNTKMKKLRLSGITLLSMLSEN